MTKRNLQINTIEPEIGLKRLSTDKNVVNINDFLLNDRNIRNLIFVRSPNIINFCRNHAENTLNISKRMQRTTNDHFDPEEADKILRAARELRRQFHAQPVQQKVPFPGLRRLPKSGELDEVHDPESLGPAYQFLRNNYGREIDEGRMGPNDLRRIDILLYATVANEAERHNKTVGDFLKVGSRDATYDRRRQAIADIIGVEYEELSPFLSAIRTRRTSSNEESSLPGRQGFAR